MNARRVVTAAVLVLAIAASGFSGTAKQYRGPEGDAPRGLFGPGYDGPIGVARLDSRSREVEGFDRWEFWWEHNRGAFLRAAKGSNARTEEMRGVRPVLAGPQLPPDLPSSAELDGVVPFLLSRLDSGDPEERAIAALGLGRARAPRAVEPLLGLLAQRTGSDRRAAALALGLSGDPRATPALIEFVSEIGIPPDERAYGALGLGLSGDARGAPVLRRLLTVSLGHRGKEIAEFQEATAHALGLLGDRGSIPLLAKIVRNHANRPDTVRAASVVALGRIGDGAALPFVLEALGDHQVEVRRAAAEALGRLRVEQAAPRVRKAFEEDSDPHVRGLAAIALARTGARGAADALLGGLAIRNPRAVRGYSALALGILGDREHAPKLRALLETPDEASVAGAAAIALGLLGDPLAVLPLQAIVTDERRGGELRGHAVTALALMGDPGLRSGARRLARSMGSSHLRRCATMATGLYDGLPAGPAVLRSLFEEPDPWVRGAAVVSLELTPRASVLNELMGVAGSRGFGRDARLDALQAIAVMTGGGRATALDALVEGVNYRSSTGAVEAAIGLF